MSFWGAKRRRILGGSLRQADRNIIAGTPDQVVASLRSILEDTRPSILALWGNDGHVNHDDSMDCIRLMGQEVMPALREIGEELDLKSPFEVDSPVSLAHTPAGELNQTISTPGNHQTAVINVEDELKETVDLEPWAVGDTRARWPRRGTSAALAASLSVELPPVSGRPCFRAPGCVEGRPCTDSYQFLVC